jgi:GNAT superfamily N-acetyltransferase
MAQVQPARSGDAPLAGQVRLVPAEAQHTGELGRICFEAFKDIADRHGFHPDFPSVAVARRAIGMLISRDDFYGVAALIDDQLVGSNYLSLTDPVAGVGPITVDVSFQGHNIGRRLMQDVIDYACRNHIERVRLMQDAFNIGSLSLYASLGFDVKQAVALMQAAPGPHSDANVRLLTEGDLDAVEQLSTRIYKSSRRNEAAAAIQYGFSPMARDRQGSIAGYQIPGMFGHGVAETEEDALALVGEMARRLPPDHARFFCPLGSGDLFRALLAAGCRTIKVMNLMTMGPYEPPQGVWLPSVLY